MNAASFALVAAAIGLSVSTAYAGPRNPNAALVPVEEATRVSSGALAPHSAEWMASNKAAITGRSSVIRGDEVYRTASPVIEERQAAPLASSGTTSAEQWVIDRNRPRPQR